MSNTESDTALTPTLMLFYPLRQRSFPAWFGIFAMLTIFIAPVISQMLVQCHHGEIQTLDAATISTESHHRAGHDMSGAHQHSHSRPAPMADYQPCGYCVLFFYTPALSDITSIVIAAKQYSSRSRIIAPLPGVIPLGRFASPMPRAPPR